MSALSRAIPVSEQALLLAQRAHDAYERRALDQFGYPPHTWDRVPPDDRRLKAEAMQELIDAGLLLLMPSCPHPEDERLLVRREIAVCGRCGAPVRMLERLAAEGRLPV